MPNAFEGVDAKLAVYLERMRADALAVQAIIAMVALVDPDDVKTDDPVPPGSGNCACGCGHVCNPRRNPANRLRSGLAPACYRRWLRWREAYPGYGLTDFVAACYRERGESYAMPVAPPAEPRAS